MLKNRETKQRFCETRGLFLPLLVSRSFHTPFHKTVISFHKQLMPHLTEKRLLALVRGLFAITPFLKRFQETRLVVSLLTVSFHQKSTIGSETRTHCCKTVAIRSAS